MGEDGKKGECMNYKNEVGNIMEKLIAMPQSNPDDATTITEAINMLEKLSAENDGLKSALEDARKQHERDYCEFKELKSRWEKLGKEAEYAMIDTADWVDAVTKENDEPPDRERIILHFKGNLNQRIVNLESESGGEVPHRELISDSAAKGSEGTPKPILRILSMDDMKGYVMALRTKPERKSKEAG